MADENNVLENKAQIREARMSGRTSGLRWGAILATAVTAIGSIMLNKAGINMTDKLTKGYDDAAAKLRKATDNAKKKLSEKKENKESVASDNNVKDDVKDGN